MVRDMTPEQVDGLLRRADRPIVLLDVREDDERATARIEPSIHIRMSDIPARQREIPSQTTVVVYCHHGHRSTLVAGFLEAHGFPDVANLQGGIDAWSHRVDRTVPRY